MRSSSRHSSRLQNRQWVVPENASAHGAPPFRGGVSTSRPRPRGLGTAHRRRRWRASCLVTRDTLLRLHSFLRKPWRERLVRGGIPAQQDQGDAPRRPYLPPPLGAVWDFLPGRAVLLSRVGGCHHSAVRHAVAAHGSRAARSYQGTEPSYAYLLPPVATRVAASLGGN